MTHLGKVFTEMYAMLSVVFTWVATVISFLQEFEVGVKIAASICAIVLSVITARYYWMKTKKLKEDQEKELK